MTLRRVLGCAPVLLTFALIGCFEPVIRVAPDAGNDPADASVNCDAGLVLCGGAACADTRTDEANCGQCGARCASADGCAGGACYPRDCAGTDCAADQVCVNQRCEFELCLGVTCPSPSLCFRGTCLSASCNGTQCAQGQACLDGGCVDPACVGVTCPSATTCVQGACVNSCVPGGACAPSEACHVGTVSCVNGVSGCTSSGLMPAGAACDGGYCNSAGTCGACSAGAACTSASGCLIGTNSCATGEPVCSFASVATPGTACTGGVCGTDGGCAACVAGAACVPPNPCLQGTVACGTGAAVCNAAGPAGAGISCGTQQVCNGAGGCVAACVPNQNCSTNPGAPCLRGTTACAAGATGAATCVDNGNAPAGDSCGGSQVCNGSGTCISLVTCYVTPTANDRTLVMSTRNWFGYTRPITVYYKMVGGGAGPTYLPGSTGTLPQFMSAGGSTAVLKNGTMVAAASGMNAGDIANPRQVVSGLFTVAITDTIRLISGGGGGFGQVGTSYTGVYDYYGWPGGGGAGYYGGGSGVRQDWPAGYPVAAPAVAFGGTGTSGGAGAAPGSLGRGGSTPGGAAGGNGLANGASTTTSMWDGFVNQNYTAGGGGGYGQHGLPGGDSPTCPSNPAGSGRGAATPLATAFDLSPISGTAGFQHVFSAPGGGFFRCGVGGAAGEIVFQYQAPTCDLIPQWNLP